MSCPACGEAISASARFCPACGQRLGGRTDERRLVTVLFADLVGFTRLAESNDPERVKRTLDRCFEWLVADIVGFGGQIDKIIGDAVVALFGAPVAHEDDAERAVRAALRMQETLAARSSSLAEVVRMRIGVNTGEVLVGAMAAGSDYTAMGDVVNIASRLQTSAAPGEVLVGPATYAATRQCIRYQPRGLFAVRGRETPVDAFVAIEPLAPPGGRTNRPSVPMVGRSGELATLDRVLDTAIRQNRAACVVLVGDAGIGKTRLADEVAASFVERHGAVALDGRCVPYGEANVWWPVAEALRHAACIEPGDEIDVQRQKVTQLVRARIGKAVPDRRDMPLVSGLVPLPGDTDSIEVSVVDGHEWPDAAPANRHEQVDVAPADDPDRSDRIVAGLLQFLGVDDKTREVDPTRAHDEAIGALATYLDATVQERPVVLQLSDLHWADEAVLRLCGSLLERLARQQFVLVTTARRSLLERWSPPAGRYDTVVLNLEALERDAASHLLRSLLDDGTHLGSEVEGALIDRSGGNPLFLEELVALVKERSNGEAVAGIPVAGGLDGVLPDTLRGLLTARLDRLGVVERTLVQDAAVFGRRGRVDWLAKMARVAESIDDIHPALGELVDRDLMIVSGDVWSFRSDLLREVAYHTLPKLERARRHLGIARWMEVHYEGQMTDSQVDQIAHHYGQVADLAADLGGLDDFTQEVRDRALHWLEEASTRAEQLRTLPVAALLYDEALTLATDASPARRLQLLLGRARVAAEARDLAFARGVIAEARELADEAGDPSGEAAALLVEGDIEQKAGDIEKGIALLDRAVARFDAAGDPVGRAEALRTRSMTELFGTRYRDAERSALAALDAYQELGDRRSEAWVSHNLAWIAFVRGQTFEAEQWLDSSLHTFRELGEVAGEHWAQGLLAYVRFQQGDDAEAERLQEQVLAHARTGRDRWAMGMMLVLGGLLAMWSGRTEEAVERSAEAHDLFRHVADPYGKLRAAWVQGRALVMTGRISEGFELLRTCTADPRALAAGDDLLMAGAALAATAVEVGDPRLALTALGADVDGPDLTLGSNEGSSAQFDRLVAGCLAALQFGRLDRAQDFIGEALDIAGKDADGYVLSAAGLVAALGGDRDGAMDAVERVVTMQRATYLDRTTARLAAALVNGRAGEPNIAMHWLADATSEVDATDDRVAQAVVRLANARVRVHHGGEDAADAVADAWARLDALGIEASGWLRLFDGALGHADEAAVTA